MKKDRQVEIQEDVYKYAWNKYKNELTMDELVKKIFKTSLPTFFRRVKKNNEQNNKNT